ncbi:MAG: two-component system sensor histidine kinase KdbD, partial [Betaproteobacteria bacterium]|nr:two-component system sensor histidine kinase KdbD [Betaproteobacteria bacterium]
PLTAIVGLAGAIEQAGGEVRRLELAGAIREEAEQMTRLVSNLLDMARLQSGGVTLRKDWHSLQEVIGSALAQLRVPLSRAALQLDVPTDLPLVEMDALLIERVLVNLLDNASKYGLPSDGTRGHLRVAASVLDAGDGQLTVRIAIEDEGRGFPGANPQELFEAFKRGERESSTTGVGLGLALCRLIVQAHGGTITAENRPQGGARVTIAWSTATAPLAMEMAA